MNVIHFFFWCVCVVNVCCLLVNRLFHSLWIIRNRNPLFVTIISMVFHSRCLSCSVIGSVNIAFIQKMKAASFCSSGWLELKSIQTKTRSFHFLYAVLVSVIQKGSGKGNKSCSSSLWSFLHYTTVSFHKLTAGFMTYFDVDVSSVELYWMPMWILPSHCM